MTENIDKLWTEAVRQHIASLPPDEGHQRVVADAAQRKEDKPDTTRLPKIHYRRKAGELEDRLPAEVTATRPTHEPRKE